MKSDAGTPRKRAADRLFAHFEEQILNGAITPGNPLPPEREIVRRHGVSRTVVREALGALANKGLITARRGYRPVVTKPGYDTAVQIVGSVVTQLLGQPGGVRNLFELRIMMEAALVREAATNASAEDLDRMDNALKENGEAIEDSARFYETDIAFHGVLYEIPHNPLLPAIHRAYTEWLHKHWRKMPRSPERNQMNFAAHRDIFQAILRRDANKAEAALRTHLDFAWDQVRNTFEELK